MRRCLAVLLLLALPLHAAEPPPDGPDAPAPPAAVPPRPAGVALEDIRLFTAIYSLIKQAYVDEVDDRRLMQSAIRGLLAGLDPHSAYLDETDVQDLAEDTSGSYAGLGIEVLQIDGMLRVIAPLDGSPALRAGMRAGDTIVRIDGKPVQSDDLEGAIAKLRGEPGTSITLGVVHEGQSAPVDITMQREIIRVASAAGRMLEPGYAYLRVSQFQEETGSQLRRRIEQLVRDGKQPLRGAVLDLRSNPGGLVDAAVEISDLFLDSGAIVSTRGRIPEAAMRFRATPGDLLQGAPLVVLVDHGTASAAEIVAGALKDNHRALIMGRRTFGKGSVQSVLPLDATRAIKLTTARYYTPDGISIQAAGIQPDIELADLRLSERDDGSVPVIGERDLRNHLRGAQERDAAPDAREGGRAFEQDYALNEALNALKALALGSRSKAGGND